MENTDARVLLQHIYNAYGYQISKNFKDNAIRDAFELADKALEKQIPKKPIKSKKQVVRYVNTYCCPICNLKFTGTGIAKWCYHCGQKLDWSDEE